MREKEVNKEIMKTCMEMAKMGIDLEQLFKDMKPIFEALQPTIDLAMKNYKFIKGDK